MPPAPAAEQTPTGPQSFKGRAATATAFRRDPCSRSFPGADIDALSDSEPPDVTADVSSIQNVQFVNDNSGRSTLGGLFVYDKTGVVQSSTSAVQFWCGSPGVNGSLLQGCVNNIVPSDTLQITDPQVGFDSALGLWIATELAVHFDVSGNVDSGVVYFAASASIDATGSWNKWSEPVCTTDPSKPGSGSTSSRLERLAGGLVAIDVTCSQPQDLGGLPGADNLVLIPNATITSRLPLPSLTAAPCFGMAPARDEQNSFSNLYLVASIVPATLNPVAGCAPSTTNTQPYLVEYTATTEQGFFGTSGCAAWYFGVLADVYKSRMGQCWDVRIASKRPTTDRSDKSHVPATMRH